jgi:hypothetical protein
MNTYEKPTITPIGEAVDIVRGSVINPPDNNGHPEQGLNSAFELED